MFIMIFLKKKQKHTDPKNQAFFFSSSSSLCFFFSSLFFCLSAQRPRSLSTISTALYSTLLANTYSLFVLGMGDMGTYLGPGDVGRRPSHHDNSRIRRYNPL